MLQVRLGGGRQGEWEMREREREKKQGAVVRVMQKGLWAEEQRQPLEARKKKEEVFPKAPQKERSPAASWLSPCNTHFRASDQN